MSGVIGYSLALCGLLIGRISSSGMQEYLDGYHKDPYSGTH
jgi:hypothetical protein